MLILHLNGSQEVDKKNMNKHMFLVIFNFFLILLIILPVTGSPIEDFAHYLGGERNITILKDRWIVFHASRSPSEKDYWTTVVGSSFSSREECSEFGKGSVERDNKSIHNTTNREHKFLCGKNCKYDGTGITCEFLCGEKKCLYNHGPTLHFSALGW